MLKASTRRRKAYGVALKVFWSYFCFYIIGKIRGKNYWDAHINDKHILNAMRIKNVMLELQGLFIKFGQLISILSNILPPEFRKPLEDLQDNVPPHPIDKMMAVVKKELGKEPNDIFTTIDPNPLAAASIGQVHQATIGDQKVVIKVQHPAIDQIVHVDLEIIQNIIRLVTRFFKVKGIEHLYQQVEQMIEEELDYLLEAQSMQRIKANLSNNELFYIPSVYEEYCSKKVLVIEYCDGCKITDTQQLTQWGIDRETLANGFLEGFCQMLLEDGFYHADPHPGNVLVNSKGQIVLLDFGAVATLSSAMKAGIPKLIECMIKQDAEEMVKILRQLGFVAQGEDAAKIAEKLIDDVQDFIYNDLQLQNLNVQNITAAQLRRAFGLINIKEMTQIAQIPKEWVLLNRAVVLVSGIGVVLVPDWNPVPVLRPYLQQQIINQNGGLAQLISNTIKDQVNAAISLPSELQKTLQKVNKGKLVVNINGLEDELSLIRGVGQQIVWLAAFFASIYFYLHTNPYDFPRLVQVLEWMAIFSFIAFWWKVLKR